MQHNLGGGLTSDGTELNGGSHSTSSTCCSWSARQPQRPDSPQCRTASVSHAHHHHQAHQSVFAHHSLPLHCWPCCPGVLAFRQFHSSCGCFFQGCGTCLLLHSSAAGMLRRRQGSGICCSLTAQLSTVLRVRPTTGHSAAAPRCMHAPLPQTPPQHALLISVSPSLSSQGVPQPPADHPTCPHAQERTVLR